MASWEYFADFFGEYYMIFIVCIGHTSFFLLSVAYSWTSPALVKLSGTEDNPLGRPITPDESDLIGSLLFVGASLGPLVFIPIVKKLGRKTVLVMLLSLVPISHVTLVFAKNVELYYICRILLGLYTGATLSVVPVYLAEIMAPDEVPYLMSFGSIFGFTGIFMTYTIGRFIPLNYFNGGIAVFSTVIIILLSLGCPETPCYMMKVEGEDESRKVLRRLRKNYVEKELEQIAKTVENEASNSYLEIFKKKKYFKSFLFATVPLLLQQFCGITLIITYSELILLETHLPIPPHICSIIIIGLLELTVFLAPTLLKSSRFSLKYLMTLSLTGTGLCNLAISLYFFYGSSIPVLNWIPLIGSMLSVSFYNCGLEPIAWAILGETYPKNIDFIGSAFSISIYFISMFPILYSFYKVDISYLFLASFICCSLGIIYVRLVFQEPDKETARDVRVRRALI